MKNFKIAKPIYLAIASILFMALKDFHVVTIASEQWDKYVNLVLLILTGLGVVTNPTVEALEQEVSQESVNK